MRKSSWLCFIGTGYGMHCLYASSLSCCIAFPCVSSLFHTSMTRMRRRCTLTQTAQEAVRENILLIDRNRIVISHRLWEIEGKRHSFPGTALFLCMTFLTAFQAGDLQRILQNILQRNLWTTLVFTRSSAWSKLHETTLCVFHHKKRIEEGNQHRRGSSLRCHVRDSWFFLAILLRLLLVVWKTSLSIQNALYNNACPYFSFFLP